MDRFFKWFGLPGRLVLSLLMSLYAIILALIFPSLPRLFAVIAMLLSSLGDIILMDYKPITDRLPLRGFVPGACVFAVAHLAYIAAFGLQIYKNAMRYINYGVIIALGIFMFIVIAASVIAISRHSDGIGLLLPGIAYLFVISCNCATVYSSAVNFGGLKVISAIGVFSFLVSDCFIVIDKVCGIKSKALNGLIWWFYPIGQILLLLGV